MNVKGHFKSIRDNVGEGRYKDAIDKLLFLSNKSALLDVIILQKSRLSELNKVVLSGTLGFEEGTIAKNQIASSILLLANSLEEEILKHKEIQTQIGLSVGEFIRKFGLDKEILNDYLKKSKKRTFQCLWIDDDPDNDKIEMDILTALDIQCQTARNPYDAYRLLKEGKPNIIVINSLTRLRDNINEGIEYCDFLNKDSRYKKIPVIMHSISIQKRIEAKESLNLPNNIKNDFTKRNSLIIKDLIEEVILNL